MRDMKGVSTAATERNSLVFSDICPTEWRCFIRMRKDIADDSRMKKWGTLTDYHLEARSVREAKRRNAVTRKPKTDRTLAYVRKEDIFAGRSSGRGRITVS